MAKAKTKHPPNIMYTCPPFVYRHKNHRSFSPISYFQLTTMMITEIITIPFRSNATTMMMMEEDDDGPMKKNSASTTM
jgi:hypothetical protein